MIFKCRRRRFYIYPNTPADLVLLLVFLSILLLLLVLRLLGQN
jgi:hypothetical protein